jgi:pimeloyl-ACP methyl ester carboxylesterase
VSTAGRLPHILILPGLDGTGNLGRRLQARLAGSQLITYPRDRVLTFDESVRLVHAAVEHDDRVIVVGESYSGAIALRYAAAYPQRVVGVVLIAGFVEPPWTRALAHVMWAWLFRVRPPRWVVRWLFAGWDANDALVDYVIDTVRSVKPEVVSGRLRQVLTTDHTAAVRDVTVPVLYVAGESDRLVKRSSLDRVRDVFPRATVARVAGPHVLSETHPDEVARAIEVFAAKILVVS